MGTQVNKTIKFKLNDKQKAAKAIEAARHITAISELKEKRSGLNAGIKEHEASFQALLKDVSNGFEERPVQCEMVKNFEENVVEYYHDGEMVESREMIEADRQEEMRAV